MNEDKSTQDPLEREENSPEQDVKYKRSGGFIHREEIFRYEGYGNKQAWYRGITVNDLRKMVELGLQETTGSEQERGLISTGGNYGEGMYVTNLRHAVEYADFYAEERGDKPFVLEIIGDLPYVQREEQICILQAPVYLWMLSSACKQRIFKELEIQPDTVEYQHLNDLFSPSNGKNK